jgi:hypothetical protein
MRLAGDLSRLRFMITDWAATDRNSGMMLPNCDHGLGRGDLTGVAGGDPRWRRGRSFSKIRKLTQRHGCGNGGGLSLGVLLEFGGGLLAGHGPCVRP